MLEVESNHLIIFLAFFALIYSMYAYLTLNEKDAKNIAKTNSPCWNVLSTWRLRSLLLECFLIGQSSIRSIMSYNFDSNNIKRISRQTKITEIVYFDLLFPKNFFMALQAILLITNIAITI